ncbi:MAG: MOSC domain-containing protein [Bacteroidota bacterium]
MKEQIDEPIKELIDKVPQVGALEWIGIRPQRRAPLKSLLEVKVTLEGGLMGDHFSTKFNKKRQVTLIQKEHLSGVASILAREILPSDTRRNLVIKGINLLSFRDRQFSIGKVVFEGTGYCHPCSRMEENLGPGGYNAMRGHGGLTARVIKEGTIRVGDMVKLVTQ